MPTRDGQEIRTRCVTQPDDHQKILLQRLGCERAYRLAMEPRRLFKRYFTYNPLFVYYLMRGLMFK